MIEGLDAAAQVEGVEIFHAGTRGGRRAHPRQWRPRAQCLRPRQNRARGAGARLSGGRPHQMAGRLLPPRYRLARGGAGEASSSSRASFRMPGPYAVPSDRLRSGSASGDEARTFGRRQHHASGAAALRRRAVERAQRRIPTAGAAAIHLRGAWRRGDRRPAGRRPAKAGRAKAPPSSGRARRA